MKNVRLHLTNVTGLGSMQLLSSLLPAIEGSNISRISEIYLPDKGFLKDYAPSDKNILVKKYKRVLPRSLSRFIECTILGIRYRSNTPLLIFGDIPLMFVPGQILFLQNSHLVSLSYKNINFFDIKASIARIIFRINITYIKAFIVQTHVMKKRLLESYPINSDKVFVVSQPVPTSLISATKIFSNDTRIEKSKLKLIYPAANYPHKNHKLLSKINENNAENWPISHLILTISPSINPAPNIDWVECIDFVNPDLMTEMYKSVDALVFLSLEESFGFPLIEAMYLGLPIICPDLPYAQEICGDSAIYFDPHHIDSLQNASSELLKRLNCGWRPDWSKKISLLPKSWSEVADQFLLIAVN
jgi:glycosyltransferase involved in cell wall biosynthesis